jgi:hypothetical protein
MAVPRIQLSERMQRTCVQRQVTHSAILAARDGQQSLLKIHVLPAQPILFASPNARLDRQIELGLSLRAQLANLGSQNGILILGQLADGWRKDNFLN